MDRCETYLNDAVLRGISIKTKTLYQTVLSQFAKEFPQFGADLERLTWLQQYLARWPNPRTRHVHYRVIKAFVRWCARMGLDRDWIGAYRPACPAAPPAPTLTQEQFDKLLAAIPHTLKGRRDRAFYMALFYTGCRRDAIRLLRWPDVNIPERWLKVKTKGAREFIFPLAKPAARELNLWRLACPDEVFVFPSLRRPNRPFCDSEATRRIGEYAKAAGIHQRVFLHLLRHSHASLMDDAGIPVQVIQAGLGHSRVSTTEIYLRRMNSQRQLRGAVDTVFQ